MPTTVRIWRAWTPREDDILRTHYRRRGGMKSVLAQMPYRTPVSISHRARILGVLRQPLWTVSEDRVLRLGWHILSQRELCRRLPGRTWRAIRRRAYYDLRLPLGVPQGCIAVTEASRKLGFSYLGLLTVLRWAEVSIRSRYPGDRRATSITRYVDFDAARAAVDRWMACESLDNAVRRHRVDWRCLHRWLRQAGVIRVGETTGYGYRLDPATVDAVVRSRRQKASAA